MVFPRVIAKSSILDAAGFVDPSLHDCPHWLKSVFATFRYRRYVSKAVLMVLYRWLIHFVWQDFAGFIFIASHKYYQENNDTECMFCTYYRSARGHQVILSLNIISGWKYSIAFLKINWYTSFRISQKWFTFGELYC